MTDKKAYWDDIYLSKPATDVSWFQTRADTSLQLIQHYQQDKNATILDVGGGSSVLVDNLLEQDYHNISVLDLSKQALMQSQQRLGAKAEKVNWLDADILFLDLPPVSIDVWHDRAVFHFLCEERQRQQYVAQVNRLVKPGGLVIVATFAEDGPEKCSGLPVIRYNDSKLHAEFGISYQLLGSEKETHITPWGTAQQFVYCFCRKH